MAPNGERERIGFVGLGNMGAACAMSLLREGHPLTLWARRSETLAPFAGSGAVIVETLAGLGARSDIVFVCVVNDHDVQEVMAEGALMAGLHPGSLVAILSTISPATCIEVARAAAAKGVTVLDAPVTGGADRALAGTLTVMVGAGEAELQRCFPVMRAFAGTIVHVGAAGMAQVAKVVNNFVFSGNVLLAGEALELAARLGVRREAMVEVLASGSGASFALSSADRILEPGSRGAKLIFKDVEILQDVLAGGRLHSPSVDRVRGQLARVVSGETFGAVQSTATEA